MDINAITKMIEIKGELFPVVDVGAGPAVLLLHGFPDSRFLWRYQLPALAAAGFRVIAPDLRGFGDAPRPTAVRPYRRPFLVADILGILDALGVQRTHLVGHDWGAALAWGLAGAYPERFDRVVVLSVGTPGNPGWNTIAQREKSWYFDFFLKTGIAEAALLADNWQLFREWSRGQGDHERHLRDLARPEALAGRLTTRRRRPGSPRRRGRASFAGNRAAGTALKERSSCHDPRTPPCVALHHRSLRFAFRRSSRGNAQYGQSRHFQNPGHCCSFGGWRVR